jgi:hypothetical protein
MRRHDQIPPMAFAPDSFVDEEVWKDKRQKIVFLVEPVFLLGGLECGKGFTVQIAFQLGWPWITVEQVVAKSDDLSLIVAEHKGMEVAVWCDDAGPGVLILFLRQCDFVEFQVLAPHFWPFRIVAVVEKAEAHVAGYVGDRETFTAGTSKGGEGRVIAVMVCSGGVTEISGYQA